ncbi:MAG: LuxR C-terminal-related transcriptional regulator [Bacteroidales bacterium]|nr:LuxR C-terminal-related transcriptional regulator [Bacteroidales bacterium]
MNPSKHYIYLLLFLCLSLRAVAQPAIPTAHQTGSPAIAALPTDSLVISIQKNYFNHGDYAAELVRELYRRAEAEQNPDLLAVCIYWDALTEYSQRNDRSNLSVKIDSLLDRPDMVRNPHNVLLLNYAKALSELAYGDFAAAFRHALDAHHMAIACNDSVLFAETASTLGNIGPYIQDYELSRHYYRLALEHTQSPHRQWRIRINYSRLLFLEEKYDSAISELQQVIPAIQQSGDSGLLAVCHLNLGSYYSAMEQRDSAYLHYTTSLDLLQNNGNRNLRLLLYENIGNYFRYKKDYAQAQDYYEAARQMALADSNISAYAALAYELSILFARQGLSDSSYYYLSQYNQLISRTQQPQTVESYRQYVNLVMELSDNRIQLSEQAVSLKNKQLAILGVTAAAIIVTVVLLWLVAMERRRRTRQTMLLKEIENRELSDQLEHEQEIQRLHEAQIEQKIRELTSYSLLLANKNNLLKTVEETAVKAQKEQDTGGYAQIKRLIDENLHMDGDYWEQFVGHFIQVAPHFFEELKQRFPDLTPNEIKLCAYIRIGMSSKQIAQMLNLSPESVNKNRYRLRKKLGLEKDTALDEIIAGL